MDAEEALAVTRAARPKTPGAADPHDPQGLLPGMKVTIAPDLDGGEEAVAGTIRAVDRETIALDREDPRAGQVCVHFPRVGYRVITVPD
jgi:glutathione S-transferase